MVLYGLKGIVLNIWFALAAALAFIVCVMHVIMGGREAARPLLAASELDQVAKFTNYYCWHLVTIAIAAVGAAFFIAARDPDAYVLGVFAVAMAASFAAWSLIMIVRFRLPPLPFGQWILFLAVAGVGGAGLIAA